MDIIENIKDRCEFELLMVERKDLRFSARINLPNEKFDILTAFISSDIVTSILSNENTKFVDSDIEWEDNNDVDYMLMQLANAIEFGKDTVVYYPMKLWHQLRNSELYSDNPVDNYTVMPSVTWVGSMTLNHLKAMIVTNNGRFVVNYEIVGDFIKLNIDISGDFTVIKNVCY